MHSRIFVLTDDLSNENYDVSEDEILEEACFVCPGIDYVTEIPDKDLDSEILWITDTLGVDKEFVIVKENNYNKILHTLFLTAYRNQLKKRISYAMKKLKNVNKFIDADLSSIELDIYDICHQLRADYEVLFYYNGCMYTFTQIGNVLDSCETLYIVKAFDYHY